jgi:hypothetical protein
VGLKEVGMALVESAPAVIQGTSALSAWWKGNKLSELEEKLGEEIKRIVEDLYDEKRQRKNSENLIKSQIQQEKCVNFLVRYVDLISHYRKFNNCFRF